MRFHLLLGLCNQTPGGSVTSRLVSEEDLEMTYKFEAPDHIEIHLRDAEPVLAVPGQWVTFAHSMHFQKSTSLSSEHLARFKRT